MEDCKCAVEDRVHTVTVTYSYDWMTTLNEVVVSKCNACGKEISSKETPGQAEERAKELFPEVAEEYVIPENVTQLGPIQNVALPTIEPVSIQSFENFIRVANVPQADPATEQIETVSEEDVINTSRQLFALEALLGGGQQRRRQLSEEEVDSTAVAITDHFRNNFNGDLGPDNIIQVAQGLLDNFNLATMSTDSLIQLMRRIDERTDEPSQQLNNE